MPCSTLRKSVRLEKKISGNVNWLTSRSLPNWICLVSAHVTWVWQEAQKSVRILWREHSVLRASVLWEIVRRSDGQVPQQESAWVKQTYFVGSPCCALCALRMQASAWRYSFAGQKLWLSYQGNTIEAMEINISSVGCFIGRRRTLLFTLADCLTWNGPVDLGPYNVKLC